MQYITRAWADGTDFIGTDIERKSNVKAGRRGMGDMICEVSNFYRTDGGNVLTDGLNPAFHDFCNLFNHNHEKYKWNVDDISFMNLVSKSYDWNSFEGISERKVIHCYPEGSYVKLDPSKFVQTEIPDGEYVTVQSKPFAKKCNYTDEVDKAKAMYDLPIIEVGGKESLGLAKLAYIIHNAKYHIGIDSGMTHFANCIKEKNDVHIYIPKGRITGVGKRWIDQGYKVNIL